MGLEGEQISTRSAPQTAFYAAARLCFKLPVERDYENYRAHHSSQPRQPSSRTLEAILSNRYGYSPTAIELGIHCFLASLQQPWCVSQRIPLLQHLARGRLRPLVEQYCTAASEGRAITKYPPCRRWHLLRPRGRVATAAIAPTIGSNPATPQTPETPHEVHLYETERAPHRR